MPGRNVRSTQPVELQRQSSMVPLSANRGGNSDATLTSTTSSNDGVFTNLNAQSEPGEKMEEQPPVEISFVPELTYADHTKSYEQAAADATPPYWETTIMAPGMISDEVYVDGIPVGSLFSFIWNSVISISFNLVGFLLTYLLHTTHAAKNGSRAGLGVTLVQYGFYLNSSANRKISTSGSNHPQPSEPNNHEFDSSAVMYSSGVAVATGGTSYSASSSASRYGASGWLAYFLMIAGWFIMIRAVTDFIKARRHEQLVLQSPDRGLHVPIVAEGETEETVA